jgi:hypothetical protein
MRQYSPVFCSAEYQLCLCVLVVKPSINQADLPNKTRLGSTFVRLKITLIFLQRKRLSKRPGSYSLP